MKKNLKIGGGFMLLVLDIGNTSIACGGFDGDVLCFTTRVLSNTETVETDLAAALSAALERCGADGDDIHDAILCSVVPALTDGAVRAVEALAGCTPLIVGENCCGVFRADGLPVREIGADLITASVAAVKKYPLPCLIADLGTATKLIILDGSGVFLGCTIAPGVKLSADALTKGAALLPEIPLSVPPRVIGTDTVACMQSGLMYGTAAMLDGMVRRIRAELGGAELTLVATGGYSAEIFSSCEAPFIFDEYLLLDGLRYIFEDAAQ